MTDLILPRIAAGDTTAVRDCLSRYGGLVWSLAQRCLANPTDCEEATQEIFIEIWQQAERFDPNLGSETGFISLLARRRLIDRLRRANRQPNTSSITDDITVPLAPNSSCPLELAETTAQVRERLAKLRPAERQAVQLSICDGLSHAEISAQTGQPLGTVKSHVRRGLQFLRQMFVADLEQGGVT
ncbi:MAG: sigma-70 family RNA polymerase sigma factor [Pirellulales bacterium]|nr:sigma-70 family RNA polymerase sigma factor [Pirellulales bacterium]